MSSKLLIITISGLAAVGSLFLFSNNSPQPESQTANIVETVATPSPSKNPAPKIKTTPIATLTPLPSQIQQVITITPTPLPTHLNIPTPTPTPVSTLTPTPTSTPSPAPEQSGKININTANKQELEKITGVGPVIAQRIIDYRQSNGPFQTIEEIKEVSGIGDIKFEKMKNEITI